MNQNQEKNMKIKLERHLWPDEKEAIRREKKERRRSAFLIIIIVVAIASSLMIGIYLGYNSQNGQSGVSAKFKRFEEIYQVLLKDWYFSKEIEDPADALIDRAIDGMIGTDYDPHTDYMTAEEAKQFSQSIDMGFTGIGIKYMIADEGVVVQKVFRDSPADKAGLQPGDIITHVDNESVIGWDIDKLAAKVKGKEGTIVHITYLRKTVVYNVDITRGTVENSVYGEIMDREIGYLQIYQFSSIAPSEVNKYLKYFTDQGVDKLIIDLRDDGGGYLTSLIGIASFFLEKGESILIQEYTDGSSDTSYTTGGNYTNFDKIVILGNEYSASASEAFIGAMTEHGKATFVGVTTYGKSTVQVPVYFADGSVLKYTSALWLTPDGNVINRVGIVPDITVKLHPVLSMPLVTLEENQYYEYDQVDENIRVAQNCLDFLGYGQGTLRTDGYFDKGTEAAVLRFQKDNRLTENGLLDAQTVSLLCTEVIREWNIHTEKYDTQLAKAKELLYE